MSRCRQMTAWAVVVTAAAAPGAWAKEPGVVKTIHEFSAKGMDGKDVKLAKYDERVCLIVNVASR